MSNVYSGSYHTTTEAMMRAFDELPPAARRALANAVENWVPQPLLTGYRRGEYRTGDDIARLIDRWNRREFAKRENQRARAVGPYKGNFPAPSESEVQSHRREG